MKNIQFPPAIAAQVKAKLRMLRELEHATNNWVKGIMQATGAAAGAEANDEIQLNEDASGIIIYEASDRPAAAAIAQGEPEEAEYEPELDTRAR